MEEMISTFGLHDMAIGPAKDIEQKVSGMD